MLVNINMYKSLTILFIRLTVNYVVNYINMRLYDLKPAKSPDLLQCDTI